MKASSTSFAKPADKSKNLSSRETENSTEPQPTHEQIARLASQLYLESGCQEGRDAENWFQAEQKLRQRGAEQPSTPASAPNKTERGYSGGARQPL